MASKLLSQVHLATTNRPIRSLRFFFTSLLFLVFSFAATDGFGQTISIEEKNIKVKRLLQKITTQSGLDFSYSPKIIDDQQKISFSVRDETLSTTLSILSNNLSIGFTILDDQIILHAQEVGQQETKSQQPIQKSTYTISGFVNDATSGESLIGATVAVKETQQGVSTNAFGYYALQLPAGKYTLLFSYVGFEVQQKAIELINNQKQNIPLQPTNLDLPSVIVNSENLTSLQTKQTGSMELNATDLDQMPQFGGESGLVKGLQALPGIKTHSDGSAFFYVRGGYKDQNLIIIDDAPIYNPSHLFGFYSVIVPDFTKSIQVYKSDMPVHLGDRLSSIIDIRTKDGNLNKTEFNAAFNPLINHLSLEGPIKKNKSSYFVSFRGSNLKWLYKKTAPRADIGFTDFNLKWNFRFNNKNRLYLTFFNGGDRFQNNTASVGISGLKWLNVTSTLRWNHIFGDRLFSNTTLYAGNYDYQIFNNASRWRSSIGRSSIKSDFTYYHRPNQTMRFGLEINGFAFTPGSISSQNFNILLPLIQEDKTTQFVLYDNNSFTWKDKWNLDIGFRAAAWQNLGSNTYFNFDENYELTDSISVGEGVYHTYLHLDPRIKLQYKIDSTSSLKFSYGIYHQNIQLISNSVSPFTSLDIWLPSSPNIKPQSAHQVSLSYLKHLPKQKLELTAEVYYKKLNRQIDYGPHPNILLNPLIEGELRFGKMQTYGLELMLKKSTGRLNGWFNYTFSRAIRQTDAVNNGRSYPAFQDRPHDISLMLNYRLKRRILFSTYWTWYTGSAFSSPTGFYQFNGSTVPIYDEKHNDRLPNYKRLDLAFKFKLNKNPNNRFQHDLTFSIYNVLSHKNIVAVNFNKVANGNDRPIVAADFLAEDELIATQADLIRFFPSLTYSFKL